MNLSNVASKHLTEAANFLIAELSSLTGGCAPNDSTGQFLPLLEAFIQQQQQDDLRGHVLFNRARLEALNYVTLVPAGSQLSPFFRTWLCCQFARTLLLACGCYRSDSPERDLHWSYYKPLIAAVQELDRPGGNGAPDCLYDGSDALVRLRPVFSLN